MRALMQRGYGALATVLSVDEVAVPRPGANEVRVRVRYAGINPIDWKLVEGQYKWMSRARPPCGVGIDLAGEVHAIGTGATRFPVGTRVAGVIPAFQRPPAAIAQFAVVPQSMLAAVPETVPLDQAAAVPVAGASALQMCRTANVQRGRRVLVHGASGGVGHLAVQIARNIGALVTATGSAANQEFLRSLRPDRVIDYRSAPPTAWGGPFDAIIDCVTALTPVDARALLAEDGRYVASTPRFPRVIFDTIANLAGGRRRHALMLKLATADLEWLVAQLAARALHVSIERRYSLDAAVAALEHSRTGRARGKLVVEMS